MIEDAKATLKDRPNYSINFVYREGNQIAHRLAKFGLLLDEERVWIEEPPIITNVVNVETVNQSKHQSSFVWKRKKKDLRV